MSNAVFGGYCCLLPVAGERINFSAMKTFLLLPMLASAFLIVGCHTCCQSATKTATSPAPAVAAPAPSIANLTGDWSWTCCEGKYHGALKLQQDGTKLTGRMYDENDTTGGTVEGTVIDNTVRFARTYGDDLRQDYILTLTDNGKKLAGDFDGARDEAVGVHFEATTR